MRAVLAGLLVTAVVLAGCSGTTDPTTSSSPAPAATVTRTHSTTVTQVVTQTVTNAPTTVTATPTSSPTTTPTSEPAIPPAIDNVTVTAVTDVSAKFSWNLTGGLDARSHVEYGSGAITLSAPSVNGTGSQSFTLTAPVTPLKSCTSYLGQVVGQSGGATAKSDTFTFRTLGAAPVLGTPSVTDIMHDGFRVNWALSGPGDIKSYVQYGPTTSYGQSTAPKTGPGGLNQPITGLTQNANYHFRVVTESGCGSPTSTDFQVRTAKVVAIDILGNSGPASFGPDGSTTSAPVTVSLGSTPGQRLVFSVDNKHTQTHGWQLAGVSPQPQVLDIAPGTTKTSPDSYLLVPDTYSMACNLHSGMTGTLTVTA